MEDIDLLLADEEDPFIISEDDVHIPQQEIPLSPEPIAFAAPQKSPQSSPNSPPSLKSPQSPKSPNQSSNLGELNQTVHQLITKVETLADENSSLQRGMSRMRKTLRKSTIRSKMVHKTLDAVGRKYETNIRPILLKTTSDLASIQADQATIVDFLAGQADNISMEVTGEIASQFAPYKEVPARVTSLEEKVGHLQTCISSNTSEVGLLTSTIKDLADKYVSKDVFEISDRAKLNTIMEVQQQHTIMLENISQALLALSRSGVQVIRTGSEPVPMGEKINEPQTSMATEVTDPEITKILAQTQGEQVTMVSEQSPPQDANVQGEDKQELVVSDPPQDANVQGEDEQHLVFTRSSESRRKKHIIGESDDEEDEEVNSEEEEAKYMQMTVEELRDLKQKQIREFELLHQRQQEEKASLAEIERSKAEEARILKKTDDVVKDPHALQVLALADIEKKRAQEVAEKHKKLTKLWEDYKQMRTHRVRPEPIHKIKCEVNSKKLLDMVVYRGGKDTNFDMLKDVKLGMFGYSELVEIHDLVKKMKGKMGNEMMRRLNEKFKRVIEVEKMLGINPDLPLSIQTPRFLTSEQSGGAGCSAIPQDLPLELGQHPQNLSCPIGVPFAEGKVIRTPEFGMFFTNIALRQCFQRSDELYKCSTVQLITLKSVCKKCSRDEEFIDVIDAILVTRDQSDPEVVKLIATMPWL